MVKVVVLALWCCVNVEVLRRRRTRGGDVDEQDVELEARCCGGRRSGQRRAQVIIEMVGTVVAKNVFWRRRVGAGGRSMWWWLLEMIGVVSVVEMVLVVSMGSHQALENLTSKLHWFGEYLAFLHQSINIPCWPSFSLVLTSCTSLHPLHRQLES